MEFLQLLGQIFGYILPFAGTIALVILSVVGLKAVKLIKRVESTLTNVDATVTNANNAIDGLNKTIEMTNKYVEDFGVTSKTVNNVSMSVEAVRYSLEKTVKKIIVGWTREYELIKNLTLSFLDKVEKKVKESAGKKTKISDQKESEEQNGRK